MSKKYGRKKCSDRLPKIPNKIPMPPVKPPKENSWYDQCVDILDEQRDLTEEENEAIAKGLSKTSKKTSYRLFSEYTFVDENNHLNLDEAYSEIVFLYNNFGLEDDSKLTEDAVELKHKILNFVDKIKQL